MNLNDILKYTKIKELSYDSQVTELPMSNLVDFDYKSILNPFPENTSKEVKKELEIISKLTNSRTKIEYELIHKVDQDVDYFFEEILRRKKIKYPKEHISLFYDITKPILLNLKSYWNRPRPNQLAKIYGIDIELIITDTIHTASYPSGHTTYAKLISNILSDMYPTLSKDFERIVNLVALSRIKQGVHYPSDNEASIVFTNYVYRQLKPKLKKYY